MEYKKIDGQLFTQMMLEGARNLNQHVKEVDALNVFPVPDGDTGTNMNLSMTSGVNELKKVNSNHIGKNADALAKGLLMGARGNSGVILSQLFRGFSKYVSSLEDIDGKQFAAALKQGVETAYKAVMKPVEGTILTVSREAADEGIKFSENESNISLIMEKIIAKGKVSLANTPELLPILKEVGVIDAGGQGLMFIYEGFLAVLRGEKVPTVEVNYVEPKQEVLSHKKIAQTKIETESIEFGYCTEFIIYLTDEIIKAQSFDEESFREYISGFGDSLVVVADEEIVKVHIHTDTPGSVLNYAMEYGSLNKIKIDNMREQHTHILIEESQIYEDNDKELSNLPKQEYGIVAVAMGDGIIDIFKSLGVDVVISGGQTMNPSTEDIINAVNQVNADKVIILPNNSNIILAAEQAQSIIGEHVVVVPSKTIPQGISSMLNFAPNASLEENKEVMTNTLRNVKTGQVTYAVRDSKFEDIEIEEGDFLGIYDGKIVTTTKNLLDTSYSLLSEMIDDDEDIVTIIYGEDVLKEQVEQLESMLIEQYPDLEIEIHDGGQPVYSFIFSID